MNFYVLARNRPLNFADPLGLTSRNKPLLSVEEAAQLAAAAALLVAAGVFSEVGAELVIAGYAITPAHPVAGGAVIGVGLSLEAVALGVTIYLVPEVLRGEPRALPRTLRPDEYPP